MKRVYLVDDEALALKRLTRMLEITGRVEIAGSATDPEAALAEIARTPIDLVFLDISMPTLDGFAVCERLPANVMVVFTTAHDEHALRAFETNAIDYLLKPVREDALARALDKLDRLRALPPAAAQNELAAAMAQIFAARPTVPERIASRLGDRIHLIDLDRISHFHAEDKLTYATTADKDYVVESTISELEVRYARAGFFRIHRATLVRLSMIAELSTTADGTRVRLDDGKRTELAVARERVKALKERLGLTA
jgi:two-component system LytT family response regulator